MAKNPLLPKRNAPVKFVNLNKSAGILDDYALRKNVATKEGTIEHIPTEDNHILNKLYSDSNYLKLDGSNANQTINLQGEDLVNVGDFGIGIDNPAEKLHVYDDSGSPVIIEVENAGIGSADFKFTNAEGSYGIYTDGNQIGFYDYGTAAVRLRILNNGDLHLFSDNQKFTLGRAQDASIYYDGTDLYIDPQEVGTGYVHIKGRLFTDDYITVDDTTSVNGYLLECDKRDYNLNTAATTQVGINTTMRASTGGSRTMRTMQSDMRYRGTDVQTGTLEGFSSQMYHDGTGNSSASRGYSAVLIQATSATASSFTGYQSSGSIENTETGTVSTYIGFEDNGIDAEDGTVAVAYNFFGGVHSVDAGTLTNAYGIYLQDQTAASGDNYSLYSLGDMILAADSKKLLFGGAADASIYYDGTSMNIKTDEIAASDLDITCGSAKTIELQNTVWDDLQVPISTARLPTMSPPNVTGYKGGQVLAFGNVADSFIYFNAQLPHTYKEGTDIKLHLHWVIPTSGAGGGAENVKWDCSYSWANIDGTFPVASTGTVTVDVQNDVLDDHMVDTIVTISGSGKTISSMLICSLNRDTAVANNYGDDAYLVGIDFHHEINTMGSRQELSK